MNRFELSNLINVKDAIGVELGVAGGSFSVKLIESGKFSNVIGIDSYSTPRHGIEEYKEALKRNKFLTSNFKLLKMSFDEALPLFDDNSIDFIYIDGFAHLGQCGGKTIFDWARKVKMGGVIAGDDYDEKWPLVIDSVNYFIEQNNFDLNLTDIPPENAPIYSQYRSWYTYKNKEIKGDYSKKIFTKYKSLQLIDYFKNFIKKLIKNSK